MTDKDFSAPLPRPPHVALVWEIEQMCGPEVSDSKYLFRNNGFLAHSSRVGASIERGAAHEGGAVDWSDDKSARRALSLFFFQRGFLEEASVAYGGARSGRGSYALEERLLPSAPLVGSSRLYVARFKVRSGAKGMPDSEDEASARFDAVMEAVMARADSALAGGYLALSESEASSLFDDGPDSPRAGFLVARLDAALLKSELSLILPTGAPGSGASRV